MIFKVVFSKNDYYVIDQVLKTIPALKDGKSDVSAINSFVKDIEIFRRFRVKYLSEQDNSRKKSMLEDWNSFVQKRDEEDYIAHSQSKNKELYQSFMWY